MRAKWRSSLSACSSALEKCLTQADIVRDAELTQAIEQEAERCPAAKRLQTHPGVGALTGLAFVLIIGRAERFQCGKQIASYLGLVPLEDSSGQRRRLGHITKQGNSLLRFLLVEAAQVTVRSDPEWRSKYFHLAMRRGRKIAKVAMARRLAVRMYWMWRKEWDYEQLKKFGSHAGQPGNRDGVQWIHRVIDWGCRSPFAGEFEVVIMIAVATEEMHGSDSVPDLKNDYQRAYGWERQHHL